MKKTLIATIAALGAMTFAAQAASVTNKDGEPRTIVVTEDGVKSELVLGAGETATFCPAGCFVTMPNGDRAALTGAETIEIVGGSAVIN